MIINRALAKRYLAERESDRPPRPHVGRLRLRTAWFRIVGVVEDVRHVSLSRDAGDRDVPADRADGDADLHAGRSEPTANLRRSRRRRARDGAGDRSRTCRSTTSERWRIGSPDRSRRRAARCCCCSSPAALAAALSGVAIYGSIWYAGEPADPEIGAAPGAGRQPRDRCSAACCGAPCRSPASAPLIGVGATLAGGRLIAGLLFDTRATDPATLAAASSRPRWVWPSSPGSFQRGAR